MAIFKEGMYQLTNIYGHINTTVIRSTGLPKDVCRRYDDRGWPLFEVCNSNSKPDSHLKIFAFDDSFDPACDEYGLRFFMEAIDEKAPPTSNQNFVWELQRRGARAQQQGVSLFTSGKDQSIVLAMYEDVWQQSRQSKDLRFEGCKWSQQEVQAFIDVLPEYEHLETLKLANMDLGDDGLAGIAVGLLRSIDLTGVEMSGRGAQSLAERLPHLQQLDTLHLANNQAVQDAAAEALLEAMPRSVSTAFFTNLGLGDASLEKFEQVLPCLEKLSYFAFGFNKVGPNGVAAILRILRSPSTLESLSLRNSLSDESAKHAIRTAWATAGKDASRLLF